MKIKMKTNAASIRIAMLLLCAVFLFAVFPGAAVKQATVFERLTVKELYADPDVLNYISSHDGWTLLEQVQQELVADSYARTVDRINDQQMRETPVTPEDVENLTKKYGLQDGAKVRAQMQISVMVERDAESGATENVWYVTYGPSETEPSLKAVKVG